MKYIYSETSLNFGTNLSIRNRRCSIFCRLNKQRFSTLVIEDLGLLSVRFRQLSLNIHEVSDYEVKHIHFSCYNYGAFYQILSAIFRYFYVLCFDTISFHRRKTTTTISFHILFQIVTLQKCRQDQSFVKIKLKILRTGFIHILSAYHH